MNKKAIGLYSEAKAVGIIGDTDDSPAIDDIIKSLESALAWNPTTIPEDDGSRISLLEQELVRLRQHRRDTQTRLDMARKFAKQTKGYESEAEEQIDRLASIRALPVTVVGILWQSPN